ncbi:MAG: hypothetical protein IT374_17605 [Polyangiaceae bacterium]|nr:hypothetical protein [Polyangiaceae bacterium]
MASSLRVIVPLLLTTAACTAPTRAQRAQEAGYELNMGLRFSRTAAALEKVARKERAAFLERHRRWHSDIKIDDIELVGTSMRPDGDAILLLSVTWHRVNGLSSHTTVVGQRWSDKDRRGFQLFGEERVQGDAGLFGEADATPDAATAAAPPRDVQFKTIVIRE